MVKRTLQEIANFFDMAVAVDEDGSVLIHAIAPSQPNSDWFPQNGDTFLIPHDLVDYSGDWRESLTLPDSWPKKTKFREGELVIGLCVKTALARWGYGAIDEAAWRRPTEAEWKVLRGEE